jgi:hypothetical protein
MLRCLIKRYFKEGVMIHLHEAYEFIESNPVTTAEILAEVLSKKWVASKDARPEWRPVETRPIAAPVPAQGTPPAQRCDVPGCATPDNPLCGHTRPAPASPQIADTDVLEAEIYERLIAVHFQQKNGVVAIMANFIRTKLRAALAESEAANERNDEAWKSRCRLLMGDKDKLKAELSRARAEALEEEPWLYAIAEPNGHWQDGESCVFQDLESCQSDVDQYNDNIEEGEPKYTVVPLYRRTLAAQPTPAPKDASQLRMGEPLGPFTSELRKEAESQINSALPGDGGWTSEDKRAILAEVKKREFDRGFAAGVAAAYSKAQSWGDECAGGSGGEIIPSGPSKGQRYGEGYYNLAESILKIKPVHGAQGSGN